MFKWTKETPTEAGWYWTRDIHAGRHAAIPRIVQIRWYVDKLCVGNWAISTTNVQWAGPIPMPRTIRRRKTIKQRLEE